MNRTIAENMDRKLTILLLFTFTILLFTNASAQLPSFPSVLPPVQHNFTNLPETHPDSNDEFDASAVVVHFLPVNPFRAVQYTSENLTMVCQNHNNITIVVRLKFTASKTTTRHPVSYGIEEMNVTVEPHNRSVTSIEIYTFLVGKDHLTLQYFLPSDLKKPIAEVDTDYEMWGIRLFTAAQLASLRFGVIGFALQMSSWAASLDAQSVKGYFSQPKIIVVHLLLQFVAKPIIAIVIALAFQLPEYAAFGLIAMGAGPSSVVSNGSTFILHGDLGKSIVMTMFSISLAIVMVPFWMFTVGKWYASNMYEGQNWQFYFPWTMVIKLQLWYLIPPIIVFTIARFSPKFARIYAIITRPIGSLALVLSAAATLTTNSWYFQLIDRWSIVLACMFYPLMLYAVGFCVSLLAGFSKKLSMTIAIEITFQKSLFALLAGKKILIAPDGEMAFVMGVTIQYFIIAPIAIAIPIINIWKRRKESHQGVEFTIEEHGLKHIESVSELSAHYFDKKMLEESGKNDVSGISTESSSSASSSTVTDLSQTNDFKHQDESDSPRLRSTAVMFSTAHNSDHDSRERY